MNTTIHPLRLAVGDHKAGSGKGCAMNVISWENGDTTITDMPACADPMLSRIVQRVNDKICTHRDGDMLCASCSIHVLDLGHRIVGTGEELDITDADRRRVWVRVAAQLARDVAHMNTDPRVMAAIVAAEAWCNDAGNDAGNAAYVATNAANAAAYVAATGNAAYVATNAANAAAYVAYATTAGAAYAAANAAYTAATTGGAATTAGAAANAAGDADDAVLATAHRAVDLFQQYTGHTPHAVDADVLGRALADMAVTA